MHRPFIASLVSLVATVCLAACGTSGQAPTSPSAGPTGPAGAVIEGTVTGSGGQAVSGVGPSTGGAAAGVRPQAASPMAGMTVRVIDTSLMTIVSDAGTFRLADIPGGRVRLQFSSSAVNATLDLANVSSDQFIQIQVQVTATSAVVVTEAREGQVALCHAEGNGSYHAILISQSAEPAHRAHGDAKVGEAVPGQAGKTFNERCEVVGPSVEIEKSTNGEDADAAPGPSIVVGSAVTWEYRVTNTGTINLTGIAIADDRGVVVDCRGLSTLPPGASMTCVGTGLATLGQYANLGTVTANWSTSTGQGTVSDSDRSHYLGIAPDVDEGGPKVTLCHRTGAGFFVKIDVSKDAEPAHLAHGDGRPGGAVPGQPGRTFTQTCGLQ